MILHIYEMYKIGKSIGQVSGSVVARGWREGEIGRHGGFFLE